MAPSHSAAELSRRDLIRAAAVTAGGAVVAPGFVAAAAAPQTGASAKDPFVYCLNTSTIGGSQPKPPLTLPQEIEAAAKAGFTAMEPWLREIEAYTKAGGDLKDLRKRFADGGIAVVDVIAFAPWLMGGDEDGANQKNMEQMKRDMETAAQVGALRIAAPPAGAFRLENLDLKLAARRYRQVLELGDQSGVVPILEFWGSSKALSTLSEALYIAAGARHPKACILTDVYHLHRGGSDFVALRLVDGAALPVMHLNDYPGDVAREKLNDGQRIMPGDGAAPFGTIFKALADTGARTALSLELFNKEYWAKPADETLKVGIEKMKAVVGKGLG